MRWLVLALVGLAVDRASRLVATDDVTEPIRQAARRRWPPGVRPQVGPDGQDLEGTAVLMANWRVRLLVCPRCVSFWLAALAALGLQLGGEIGSWPIAVLVWWGVAGGSAISLGMVP